MRIFNSFSRSAHHQLVTAASENKKGCQLVAMCMSLAWLAHFPQDPHVITVQLELRSLLT